MADYDLTINMIDKEGGSGRISVKNIVSSNAKNFVDYIKSHVDAKITSYTVSTNERYAILDDDASDGTYDLVHERMVASFIQTDDDGKQLGNVRITLPTIRDEDVDDDEQMTSGAAEDLKDALNTVTGRKHVFQGAYLEIQRPNNVKAKTSGV